MTKLDEVVPSPEVNSRPAAGREGAVELGVILAGRWAAEIGEKLDQELATELARRYPTVEWQLTVTERRFRPATTQLSELLENGREVLLGEHWNLALLVTDLPARRDRSPVRSYASPTHGVGIVSLPTLGQMQLRRRLAPVALDVIAELVGEASTDQVSGGRWRRGRAQRKAKRRLSQLAAEPVQPENGWLFALRVIFANTLLLSGMVRANRPWRLVARLYRSLVGALAFVSFAVLGQGIWQLAVTMGLVRLSIVNAASLGVMVALIIIVHGLWERPREPEAREQAALFNIATILTLLVGATTLYVVVMLTTLTAAEALIPPSVLGTALHQPASIYDYIRLAWLIASLATVGGALGATLESHTAVREATYAPGPAE